MFVEGTAAHDLARACRIDPHELPLVRERAIELAPSGAGFEPSSLLIGILIKDGSQIAMDVWKRVLLPRLRARFGDDAIKEKKGMAPEKPTAKRGVPDRDRADKRESKTRKKNDSSGTPKSSE